MKKFIAVVALSVAALHVEAGSPITSGVLTNPAANTILVDTGALPGPANHTYQLLVSSSVAAVVVIEVRDAANATNIWAHTIPIAAMQPFQLKVDSLSLEGDQQRIRIRLNAAITGVIQASVVTD